MNAQPQSRSREQHHCPVCGASDLLAVTISVGGAPMEFTTCHACEQKWWQHDGRSLALSDVLTIASSR